AATPQTLSKLTKLLGTYSKGVNKAFVESIVRELHDEGGLFEYPAATKTGGARFGVYPPPPDVPPLERPKHKKAIASIIKSAEKLLAAAHVSVDDLLRLLRDRIGHGPETLSAAG